MNTVIKGIVSQYCGRLQMFLLYRSEVHMIPLKVYFKFQLHFILEFFFKMASVRVRFSPVFPLGRGFPAEQFLLRRYSILLCRK
jgi:hypothetical protein